MVVEVSAVQVVVHLAAAADSVSAAGVAAQVVPAVVVAGLASAVAAVVLVAPVVAHVAAAAEVAAVAARSMAWHRCQTLLGDSPKAPRSTHCRSSSKLNSLLLA